MAAPMVIQAVVITPAKDSKVIRLKLDDCVIVKLTAEEALETRKALWEALKVLGVIL